MWRHACFLSALLNKCCNLQLILWLAPPPPPLLAIHNRNMNRPIFFISFCKYMWRCFLSALLNKCWAGPPPSYPPHLHLPCRYGAEGAKITGPARPPSPPPGSERLLLNNMVTPRFLKPAEKLICFRSVETVKDISRRFFLMNMKGLKSDSLPSVESLIL